MATVVVIDDQDDVREMFALRLTSWGHRVLDFEDGALALEYVDFADVDLVITDLKMPTDGSTVIRTLHNREIDVPIIVISGHLLDHDEEKLIVLGAQAVLPKPLKSDLLKTVMSNLLDGCKV